MKKILLFSSICKPKEILEVVIPSFLNLETKGFEYDVILYDDNKEQASSVYLNSLVDKHKNLSVVNNWVEGTSNYANHAWHENLVQRIVTIKNKALELAVKESYDYIFLVDADLVLHPSTLQHLVSQGKDFVFELFWTLFTDADYVKPNCWDKHSWAYTNPNTILQLKTPGTYKVGAGGACTLLSSEAIKKGVSFSSISNLGYNGEDRHICTRAEVLGFGIYIDTHYPAYHIHNVKNTQEAKEWYENGAKRSFFDAWLDKHWETKVNLLFTPKEKYVPKSKFELYRIALYKAKRAFKNYLRYNSI